MESKVNVKLMGGLGNYLFQIAAAYSYGLGYNKKVVITYGDSVIVHKNILTYSDNILHNLHMESNTDLSNYKGYQEPHFHYESIPLIEGNLQLNGYFQSEKYFIKHSDEIKNLFKYPKHMVDETKEKFSDLLKGNTCSLHVRRGDYLTKPNIHPTQDLEYYKKAVSYLPKDSKLLVFSDDISWCRNNFEGIFDNEIVFVEGNTDYIDLLLMSLCDNNIICNSSFSWWSAWLNSNDSKVIVSPNKWFGPVLSDHNTKDLIPDNWHRI